MLNMAVILQGYLAEIAVFTRSVTSCRLFHSWLKAEG